MEFDLQRAKNVCDMNKQCPAFIPSWVSGDELEAAKKLLDAIAAILPLWAATIAIYSIRQRQLAITGIITRLGFALLLMQGG